MNVGVIEGINENTPGHPEHEREGNRHERKKAQRCDRERRKAALRRAAHADFSEPRMLLHPIGGCPGFGQSREKDMEATSSPSMCSGRHRALHRSGPKSLLR